MQEVRFKIRGMNCKACALLIEDEIRELLGVEESQVDFNTNTARVLFDPAITDKVRIFKLVESLGNYKCFITLQDSFNMETC